MEVQVDFFGIDFALKLVLIWYLFSHDVFCIGSKLFILKVRPYLYRHVLDNIYFLQKHSMHTLIVFSFAKGLATCRLGGVISTQKCYFESYLRYFECFLHTNHMN